MLRRVASRQQHEELDGERSTLASEGSSVEFRACDNLRHFDSERYRWGAYSVSVLSLTSIGFSVVGGCVGAPIQRTSVDGDNRANDVYDGRRCLT